MASGDRADYTASLPRLSRHGAGWKGWRGRVRQLPPGGAVSVPVVMAADQRLLDAGAAATCSPDTRWPTGLARGAGGSPHARVPTASSNSRRLTSWTGWPISCRRRGSTGIAITGCSPRITSSGPPSRPSPSGMSASGAMPRPVGMRSTDMRRAEMPPATAAAHATNHPPTTPRDAKGQTHGPGGRGVSCCVPGVLTHLGEPLEPPPVSPARGPPTDWGELVQVHNECDMTPAIDIHSL